MTSDNRQRKPLARNEGGVSVIFPVYNESFIIEQTLRNYISELEKRINDIEFIVAEDGSTDDTKAVLERLADELPIKLYTSDHRKGYQEALKDALKLATKPWCFVVDSDYQFAAIDFWLLEPLRENNDIIMGIKIPRKDPLYRIALAHGYNLLIALIFKVKYKDMDTGFRLYRREVVDKISPSVCYMSFFNAEFAIRAHLKGYRIAQVPVKHYARKHGTTNIFFISSLFLISFKQLIGLIRLRKDTRGEALK